MKDFIIKLLEKDPNKRINVEEAVKHPWVSKNRKNLSQEQ